MNTLYFGRKDLLKDKREADKRWAEKHSKTHKRINFYIPRELAERLSAKAKESEYKTVSAFLLDAANKWLSQPE